MKTFKVYEVKYLEDYESASIAYYSSKKTANRVAKWLTDYSDEHEFGYFMVLETYINCLGDDYRR